MKPLDAIDIGERNGKPTFEQSLFENLALRLNVLAPPAKAEFLQNLRERTRRVYWFVSNNISLHLVTHNHIHGQDPSNLQVDRIVGQVTSWLEAAFEDELQPLGERLSA